MPHPYCMTGEARVRMHTLSTPIKPSLAVKLRSGLAASDAAATALRDNVMKRWMMVIVGSTMYGGRGYLWDRGLGMEPRAAHPWLQATSRVCLFDDVGASRAPVPMQTLHAAEHALQHHLRGHCVPRDCVGVGVGTRMPMQVMWVAIAPIMQDFEPHQHFKTALARTSTSNRTRTRTRTRHPEKASILLQPDSIAGTPILKQTGRHLRTT